ncbi:hypothetical protein [Aquimarina muelleri]|uniref:Uncharacterized protein n=1 Tax=Aquimarina muelleri TaxID=279356 RepID=A0A918JW99_9FLAO|nr:hypothetical protein [Aquimarina muelleri]MCX2764436.1 hypothetical protein [Aquimarina muelleri]GGX21335.1 hypothetical protein GCM10007384_23200 [Aquimarina muelleri]
MIKIISRVLFVSLFIVSCQKEKQQNPFEITKNRIGLLTNEIKIKQLDSIFAKDSVVRIATNDKYLNNKNEIEVFEKGGAKLLILEPNNEGDSTSTIENIQIIDPRYKTASGLSSNSTFKDIKDHYEISKINNTLSTAVIFIDSIQAYFTIDKKELSKDFEFTTDKKIKVEDIPDSAKIKNFWIHWNSN